MNNTISITLGRLAALSAVLGELQTVRKSASMAFQIARWTVGVVQPEINAFQTSEQGVFEAHNIEPENGAYRVAQDDENFEAIMADLESLRTTRVDIEPFPVDLEELVESIESFEDNAATEGLFIALIQLREGEPQETVH